MKKKLGLGKGFGFHTHFLEMKPKPKPKTVTQFFGGVYVCCHGSLKFLSNTKSRQYGKIRF